MLAFARRRSSRWVNRFFMTNDVFHFKYEAYLEVRETSQTHTPRLLAEEAHDG